MFEDTGIRITTAGRSYLGSTIGGESFKETYIKNKVEQWVSELEKLASIASSQPQAAYTILIHSIQNKWSYLTRTTEGISHLLHPVEDAIRHKVIPAITGREAINDAERRLFALPTRLGGLAIDILPKTADKTYQTSKNINEPLSSTIIRSKDVNQDQINMEQESRSKRAKQERRKAKQMMADEIKLTLNGTTKKAMMIAEEKGASAWLNTIPIEEHGFTLHKGAFRDAMALRYGWHPNGLPSICACGKANGVDHALSCPRGGFIIKRHNEIRDVTASLLKDVASAVEIEPNLQPLTGEVMMESSANIEDNSRLDVKCTGFWNPQQDAFLDVRVFNPLVSRNRNKPMSAAYLAHEKEKRREYDRRVREIEHGTFTPIVLAATGGMGPAATIFFQRLAEKIAHKQSQPYSQVMAWIRRRMSFSLLRSAIAPIRGSRSSAPSPDPSVIEVAEVEANNFH